jgi:hypothetical protein
MVKERYVLDDGDIRYPTLIACTERKAWHPRCPRKRPVILPVDTLRKVRCLPRRRRMRRICMTVRRRLTRRHLTLPLPPSLHPHTSQHRSTMVVPRRHLQTPCCPPPPRQATATRLPFVAGIRASHSRQHPPAAAASNTKTCRTFHTVPHRLEPRWGRTSPDHRIVAELLRPHPADPAAAVTMILHRAHDQMEVAAVRVQRHRLRSLRASA